MRLSCRFALIGGQKIVKKFLFFSIFFIFSIFFKKCLFQNLTFWNSLSFFLRIHGYDRPPLPHKAEREHGNHDSPKTICLLQIACSCLRGAFGREYAISLRLRANGRWLKFLKSSHFLAIEPK
jgi:hypothetical protein